MSVSEKTRAGNIVNVPGGEVIFKEHDQGAEMYIVLQGSVEICTTDTRGRKIKLAEVSQGGFFGEMSLLTGECRKTSAVAGNDSILMVITEGNFDAIVSKNPQLALRIMKGLAGRIGKTGGDGAAAEKNGAQPVADNAEQPAAANAEQPAAANAGPPAAENAGQQGAETGAPPAAGEQASGQAAAAPGQVDDDDPNLDDIGPEVNAALLAQYFFNKKIACPVCGGKFETLVVRDSRLKQRERTDELRVLYQDIEPLLYNIWICPECYYAMKNKEFDKINEIQRMNLANQTAQRKEKYKLSFGGRRTLGFALKAYKIAIECCDSLGKNKVEERIAALWMNVAWLYDDLKETEKAQAAREQAVARYKNAYMVEGGSSDKNDQKLEYLIGKLSFGLNNLKEAREYMFRAVSRRDGHLMLKELARDVLEKLK